ncbi:hypothetical protein EVAR_61320_1 [Eumeta japonica]|uniref:Uncharacterized protein n=1 Tax=Eumeta variegata TaxID=151549 RepID=A0A4C1Y569_EUMVA|nr:hypothetical protein EVAR_61320_1 [Eumeta japonica]
MTKEEVGHRNRTKHNSEICCFMSVPCKTVPSSITEVKTFRLQSEQTMIGTRYDLRMRITRVISDAGATVPRRMTSIDFAIARRSDGNLTRSSGVVPRRKITV